MLEKYALGGQFKKQSKHKNGFYFIELDIDLYHKLKEIDDDLDKAIFYTVIENKVKGKNREK